MLQRTSSRIPWAISSMNRRRFTIPVRTALLVLVLLAPAAVLTPTSAAAWKLYEPVGEVVLPPGDANVPRAVEEKDGYVYLLAREGILYTYDLLDLPLRQSFAACNTPVRKQTVYNGNGVLRYGDYLYAFGGNGIQTIDVHEPNMPALLGLKSDLNIFNLVRHEDYLIAAGRDRIAVYSIAELRNCIRRAGPSAGRRRNSVTNTVRDRGRQIGPHKDSPGPWRETTLNGNRG